MEIENSGSKPPVGRVVMIMLNGNLRYKKICLSHGEVKASVSAENIVEIKTKITIAKSVTVR
ncbi:hypothetical protein [Paenibacillus xylanilyticus]|uniref:hypothetical protein n=1 Tax=Paenibacillus xylanilyticus TaxID=248903 RepID=UPI0039A02192